MNQVISLIATILLIATTTLTACAQTMTQQRVAAASDAHRGGGSGIYGNMIAAMGNAPSESRTYECVKVFDRSGERLIAKGECSGPWAAFRVPLPPDTYVVEAGGSWKSEGGKVHFQPDRKTVQITDGEWIDMGAPKLPGPVP